jgi:predicted RNA methylase
MLEDKVRNSVYERSLSLLCSGKIVADIGAGSGILSLMASRSGASTVFAIERSGIIKLTEANIKANRMEEKIKLIYGLAEEV